MDRANPVFTHESFKNIIQFILKYNYIFLRFDEKPFVNKKLLYLRHDVDISPYCAKELGEIEYSLGVKANYFFQINAETYNIFSSNILEIIHSLRSIGHCVGIHIDQLLFKEDEETIYNTLLWFNKYITEIDFVVSFHRPSVSVLGKKYHSFINAYQEVFFSNGNYLSDSRRNKEFYFKLQNYIENDKTPIQLLLHPEWWYPENDIYKFKDLLVKRKTHELEIYLKNNFNKVFGNIIKDENCNFGL